MSNVPQNANDANLNTRWSHTMPTWIQADVGSVTRISFVKIAWHLPATNRYNYNIEISSTGATNTFTKVAEGTSTTTTGLQTVNFTDIQGRYVRVNVLSSVGSATPTPISSRLKDFGGPKRNHVNQQLYVIWWGSGWNSGGPLSQKNTLKSHYNTICLNSDYWKGLWQYNDTKPITTVTHVDNTQFSVPSASAVTFQQIIDCVLDTRTRGIIPQFISTMDSGWNFDLTHLYLIMIPPNKSLPPGFGGATSRAQDPVTGISFNWSAQTPPDQTGPIAGTTAIQTVEQAAMHELMHAYITPTVGACTAGNGWLFQETNFCNNCQHGPPNGTECNFLGNACHCGNRLRFITGTSILVESYWSNMDGGCRAPGTSGAGFGGPSGADVWTRPPASTTTAGITELEVYGQSLLTPPPPPPTIPPPGPSPSPPPAPPAPTPPPGSLDTDGVKMIMQKNMNPGKFHKNLKDVNTSGNLVESTFLDLDVENSRGVREVSNESATQGLVYFHMISREGSFASGGSNWTARPEWVSNRCSTPAGISGARSRGYLCNENDPKNIEYTMICRVADVKNERDSQHNLTMKFRGDDHSDTNEKTLQAGMGLWYSDVPSSNNLFHIETTHPDVDEYPVTFVSPFTSSNHPRAPVNGWIGIKSIVWNINNNAGIHAELWVDMNPITSSGGFTNNWQKVYFIEQARSDTPIWGGPRCQFRIDMAGELDVAAYSLHEILPPVTQTGGIVEIPEDQDEIGQSSFMTPQISEGVEEEIMSEKSAVELAERAEFEETQGLNFDSHTPIIHRRDEICETFGSVQNRYIPPETIIEEGQASANTYPFLGKFHSNTGTGFETPDGFSANFDPGFDSYSGFQTNFHSNMGLGFDPRGFDSREDDKRQSTSDPVMGHS